jgi:hypothetical protein
MLADYAACGLFQASWITQSREVSWSGNKAFENHLIGVLRGALALF